METALQRLSEMAEMELGAPSRTLSIAAIGAGAGIGGVMFEAFMPKGFPVRGILAPAIGGAASALLANQAREPADRYEQKGGVAVLGIAAGLGGSVLAKQLIPDVQIDPDTGEVEFSALNVVLRAIIGAAFGGAAGATAGDTFLPPEFKPEEF